MSFTIGNIVAVIADAAGNLAEFIDDGGIKRLRTSPKIEAGANIIGKVGVDSAETGGLALETTLTTIDSVLDSIKDADGIKKITDPLPAGTNNIGDVDVVSSALPAGAATEATLSTRATEATLLQADGRLTTIDSVLDSIKDTDGIKKITDQLPAGTNEIGAVKQGTPAAATSPWAIRLSDGSVYYKAPTESQLPAALVGGRLDVNNGAWLGSTAPTVGQKVAASSVPVIVASDQTAIPVTVGGGNPTTVATDFLKTSGGSEDMVVDGSTTPVDFEYGAHATKDTLITSMRFVFVVSVMNFNGANFGKGAGALTNGVEITAVVNDGTSISLATLTNNEDFLRLQGSTLIEPGGITDVLVASIEFSGEVHLEAGTSDYVRVRVNDDLTSGARDIKYLTCTFYGVES